MTQEKWKDCRGNKVTELKDNEAVIIFSREGIHCVILNYEDDDLVSEHVIGAIYIYIMLTHKRDKIQPIIIRSYSSIYW